MEPKACPFCEAASIVWSVPGGYIVECNDCCATSDIYDSPEEAVAAWNARPAEIRMRNELLDALDLKAGHGPTALTMVLNELEMLRAQLRWIPVVKRLPDPQSPRRVLILTQDGLPLSIPVSLVTSSTATHWMEVPPRPKQAA